MVPEALPVTDRNIALLKDVWTHLVKKDASFIEFRENMDPVNSIPVIERWLISNKVDQESKRVVIDGFYFFSPIQERMIRLIIKAGYEPVFIIPYREEHPLANEIWTELYDVRYGYESKDGWLVIEPHSGNEFGELLEGRDSNISDVSLKEYHNVMGMVDDLRDYKGRMNLYSPNAKAANSILQDFFPERYGLRRLSSYPIGAFIRTLHLMWDEKSQSLILDEDLLVDSFVSGWVSFDGTSSDMAISDLEKVLPFFKGCSTVDAWRNRSHLLYTIHNDVMSLFQPESDDPDERRWLRILDDPLGNFSVFDVDRRRVELIIGLIDNLIECARSLFGDGKERSMADHFGRLLKVLQDNEVSEEQKEELSIATEYIIDLSNHSRSDRYNPSDLINALLAFLDNEVPVDEEDNSTDWVRPLYDIEGNEGPIHLCLCDHQSLPGRSKGYVWPLTDELMEAIRSEQSKNDACPLIDNTIFITESSPVANRYLVYSAFNTGPVTISWISEDNGKKLAPSPYMSLISKFCNVSIATPRASGATSIQIKDISGGKPLLEPFIIPQGHRIPEVNYDVALCCRRYLYGYILDDRPSFTSEFHYNFAIGGLISALREVQKGSGFSRQMIECEVFELFPFLTEIEKRNILDRIPQPKYKGDTRYHDFRFTDTRLEIHFPKPLRETIDKNMSGLRLNVPIDALDWVNTGLSCIYCPHSGKCPHSLFNGDLDD